MQSQPFRSGLENVPLVKKGVTCQGSRLQVLKKQVLKMQRSLFILEEDLTCH